EVELAAGIGGLDNGPGSVPFPPVPIVAPSPPQSCHAFDGLTYDYTSAGTRTGLGPPTVIGGGAGNEYTSTMFMQYGRVGYSSSDYPTEGIVVDLGNGGMCCGILTTGGIDYMTGGANVWVRCTVIGPGTLSVVTVPHIYA